MKIEKKVKEQIVRNALLSIFIYALPVLLMFAVFHFTGQKPWLKKPKKHDVSFSIKR